MACQQTQLVVDHWVWPSSTLLIFSSCNQSLLGLCTYRELRLSVDSVWVAHKLIRLLWSNGKVWDCNQRGIQSSKSPSPPLCCLMWVRKATQVKWFVIWWMRWHHWRRHYHKWALLPRHSFALYNVADHHQNDLHCLSINKVTQNKEIRHAIVSELESH